MNASDILKYGHLTVHQSVEGLTDSEWTQRDVCGWWSCKDILAHLASFEQVLIEVLASFTDGAPMPTVERMGRDPQAFNDTEVAARESWSASAVVAEYDALYARTLALIADIPAEVLRQPGTIPWYGDEYALDDLIVYQYYGHKREHMAQVDKFKDEFRATR
jgi:hypothetical protein